MNYRELFNTGSLVMVDPKWVLDVRNRFFVGYPISINQISSGDVGLCIMYNVYQFKRD